ncbi:hypothetical protein EJB05_21353, partial [Eragrostis curvula]
RAYSSCCRPCPPQAPLPLLPPIPTVRPAPSKTRCRQSNIHGASSSKVESFVPPRQRNPVAGSGGYKQIWTLVRRMGSGWCSAAALTLEPGGFGQGELGGHGRTGCRARMCGGVSS